MGSSHHHNEAEERVLHHRESDHDHGHAQANDHDHGHSHHHHHHHQISADNVSKSRLTIAIIINLLFVGAEYALGYLYNSVGLRADAAHNLSDVGGLVVSFAALLLMARPSTSGLTYGYRKASIYAASLNSLALLAIVGVIIWECVEKLLHPAPSGGWAIIATAIVGIGVNGFTVYLLSSSKGKDLNMKSAYLHMLADTLVSAGVALSGVLILLTGWSIIDPIIGLVVAAVILWSSRELFSESLRLALDGVPAAVNTTEITHLLTHHANVESVHHLHIWPISTTENALTAHVVLKDPAQWSHTKWELKEQLEHHSIHHVTLEMETPSEPCTDRC